MVSSVSLVPRGRKSPQLPWSLNALSGSAPMKPVIAATLVDTCCCTSAPTLSFRNTYGNAIICLFACLQVVVASSDNRRTSVPNSCVDVPCNGPSASVASRRKSRKPRFDYMPHPECTIRLQKPSRTFPAAGSQAFSNKAGATIGLPLDECLQNIGGDVPKNS